VGIILLRQVTLVSKRAVWMAHYWESYSNGKWELPLRQRDNPEDEVWIQRVVMHLKGEPVTNPLESTHDSPSTGKKYLRPSDS
jgi:hypothetical protein